MHGRTLIRNWAVDELRSNLPDSLSEFVYGSHQAPLPGANNVLLAICVYTPREEINQLTYQQNPREMIRDLTMTIDCFTNAADSSTAVDSIAEQVESVLGVDLKMGGNATDIRLISTDITFDEVGSRVVGVATLTYTVEYISDHVVDTGLVWLNQVDSQFDLGDQEDADMTVGKAVLNALGPGDV